MCQTFGMSVNNTRQAHAENCIRTENRGPGVTDMKVFTYSEARQNLSKLLQIAQKEEVEIRRRDGAVFSLAAKRKKTKSPFDVCGIETKATTQDILYAVKQSRMG